jgi:hypothetical protein
MRHYLSTFFSFIVNSNIWIALGAIAWIEMVWIWTDAKHRNIALEILIFASTLLVYNLHRLLTLPDKDNDTLSFMHRWMYAHPLLQKILIAASVLMICLTIFFVNLRTLMLIISIGLISIFYAVPVPFSKGIRLRDIGLLKPFFVSLAWSIACVVLPLIDLHVFPETMAMLTAHCFLFFMAITLPFDIRDIRFDRQNLKYATLPMLAGVATTKWIALFFLTASGIILWKIQPETETGIIIWYALTGYLIMKTKKESHEYHYTFWLDGTIIFGYLFMWLAVKIF